MSAVPVGVSFGGSLLLAGTFVLSHYYRGMTREFSRRWQALSSGVAVAYVFGEILPELAWHGPTVAASAFGSLLDTKKRVYLWALGGFVTFAALSRLRYGRKGEARHGTLYFGGTLTGYALYVVLIGYLLVSREASSYGELALYVVAIGLHLFMIDGELAGHFERRYAHAGRFLLAGCALLGWGLGIAEAMPDTVTARLFAVLAGGILIPSAHAETRAEAGARFWWFVWGAIAYAIILMLV